MTLARELLLLPTQYQKKNIRGFEGYTNCEGPTSYMVINQYLSSCANWKMGKPGVAATVVAGDACTISGEKDGVLLYSRSTCTGDAQYVTIYSGDNTCSGSGMQQTIPLECHYYGTQSSFQIYSATTKCVVDGVKQRCTVPLTTYDALVSIEGVQGTPNYSQIYRSVFESATVSVSAILDLNSTDNLLLNLSFCTQYEDVKYATAVKNLGQTTLTSVDAEKVCWTCLEATCANTTICGTNDYCTMTEQCTVPTTTPAPTPIEVTSSPTVGGTTDMASSTTNIFVSLTLMMGLFLSWMLF